MTPDEFFAGIAESKFPELVLPVPLGELPTVEDVAQTVVFLSLPESKHMSAQIIAVDSGQVMAR